MCVCVCVCIPPLHLLSQVDEQYQKRAYMETELMNERHEHELETLKAELDANMRELQEIQVSHVYTCIAVLFTHV